MPAPRWAERYALCRFKEGGRDWPNVDCWGVIRLVLKEQVGIEVPTYGEVSARGLLAVAKTIEADSSIRPWVKVDVPQTFDIVKMNGDRQADRRTRPEVHVGIMVSETDMLHVELVTDHAVIVPLSHPSVACRFIGVYRHEALT